MILEPQDYYKIPYDGVEHIVLSLRGLRHLADHGKFEKVDTLQRLSELVTEKRSVFAPRAWMRSMAKPRPAAFVYRMSGEVIQQLIRSGLYVYESIQIQQENK